MWNNEVKGRHQGAVPFLYDAVCYQSRHAKKIYFSLLNSNRMHYLCKAIKIQ